MRFWACLGVDVTICPPHRPDKNAFVERYHRSYNQECLLVDRPTTVAEVREVTASYKDHDNHARPNQALSCGNRPPRLAFPALPARPSVPLLVDPDAWLHMIDGRAYVRRVQNNGCAPVGEASYDAGRDLVGQQVAFRVDAAAREFVVIHGGVERGRVPMKGLLQRIMPFDAFIDTLAAQARTTRRATLPVAG